MDYLLTCPCGHTVADHDRGTCRNEMCACRRDAANALEAAMAAAFPSMSSAKRVTQSPKSIAWRRPQARQIRLP
jgi:hypothetical protein